MRFLLLFLGITLGCGLAAGQTTSFTYQGKLNDGGTPANGVYDLTFRLFDAANAGSQIGTTVGLTNVQAVGGIFSVQLDFGAAAFTGADRFLEISISPAGQGSFATLAPRQKLNSAPYSIQSLNAANALTALNAINLGGTPANQFVLSGDARLSDARMPLPGSGDYVQNTIAPQSGANFNIGGTGVAGIFDASQFNINGNRIISAPGTLNLFIGLSSGQNISSGFNNTFFGNRSGLLNTTGNNNTFIGQNSGVNNTFGSNNIFIGQNAGNPNGATQVSGSIALGNGVVVDASNTIVIGTSAQSTIVRGKLATGIGIGQPFTPGAGWIESFSIPNGPDGIFAGNIVLRGLLNNPPSTAGPVCYSNLSFGITGGVILNRCFSSLSFAREKSEVEPFSGGLDLIEILNPVSFKRKPGGRTEIGLNVEDVTEAAPSLLALDQNGAVEKISEAALTVVLINSVKQQQTQIESQQRQIDALKKLICQTNADAEVCKEKDR